MNPLSPAAVRLAAALEVWPRRTVRLAELWQVWARVEPTSAAAPTRRSDLAAVLAELAAAGLARGSKSLDRAMVPHLPTVITLPAPAPTPSAAVLARATVWRPELAWAVQTRLTLGRVNDLRSVNAWLRDHAGHDDVLPLRERSLEILGNEKALDQLVATGLFGPGRLTLDLLRCFRTHPPLASVRVGHGPVLLVVENEDTFFSARAALAVDPGPVSYIAWGAGGAFESSVRSTADLPDVTRVRYFGDIDTAGLRIPASAARTSALEGGPPVLPAIALYRALLDLGVPQGGQVPQDAGRAADLAAWLDEQMTCAGAATLLERGERVPQESLTSRWFMTVPGWQQDL